MRWWLLLILAGVAGAQDTSYHYEPGLLPIPQMWIGPFWRSTPQCSLPILRPIWASSPYSYLIPKALDYIYAIGSNPGSEHEDPFDDQVRDLEERYQRYSRKAEEYREKAEELDSEAEDSAHMRLSKNERIQRRRHYERLAAGYEGKARRTTVQLKRLQRYERYRVAEDRDEREIERLTFLESQRPLSPPERRRLELLRERIHRRKEQSWR